MFSHRVAASEGLTYCRVPLQYSSFKSCQASTLDNSFTVLLITRTRVLQWDSTLQPKDNPSVVQEKTDKAKKN